MVEERNLKAGRVCLHGKGGARRANVIGRLTLYALTVFMVSAVFLVPMTYLWLVAVQWPGWFDLARRAVLSASLASGCTLFVALFIFHRHMVPDRDQKYYPTDGCKVHVALTAYNDEVCIAEAVRGFQSKHVDQLIVVENNSHDQTKQEARDAGATVVTETTPGYGACCMRALAEAAEGMQDTDIIILCEGDLTFVAADIPKFLAYIENADLVLGTRATQELRQTRTQMDWLINPANQIVAKMIQARFWGTRLTDVGCTYRAIRVNAYRMLRQELHVTGNHFSPHMLIEALKMGMCVLEIPIVFKRRGGLSKGVGSDKIKAARVAIQMLGLLYRA